MVLMSTFAEALEQLRANQPNPARYGYAFERLMVNYIKADPVLSTEYSEVYQWLDWPYTNGRSDYGIDLVAKRAEDGAWTAIQCKFFDDATTLSKRHLDSFFEASGRSFRTESGVEQFANRVIISTKDAWSKNAESMLENQVIPAARIGLADIAQSPIDWDLTFPGDTVEINLTKKETFEPRPHQERAIAAVMEGLETHDRGKLIMACGTGKTFTSLRLAERVAEANGGRARVLFLVPSIALLSQTMKEWLAQTRMDLKPYAVCSDSKVSKKAEDIASYDLEIPVSTNGAAIAERFSHGRRAAGLQVIFSTYQSIEAIHDAQQQGLDDVDLIICDEAHRTTGVTLAHEDSSNFVKVHDPDYIRATKRVYMTATPRLFDQTVKDKAEEHSAEITSMDDEAVFGPEFFRLGFGDAVDHGLLTDYKVLVMTVDEDVAAEALARKTGTETGGINLATASAMIGVWNALAKRSGTLQGGKAGFSATEAPMHRAVAFAKDIKTSTTIATTFPALIASHQEQLRENSALDNAALHNIDLSISAEHVDGSMNAMQRNSRISWLESTMNEHEARILTNARCLSEGVDVPALDAVTFFNPRNSMVDVVQSVGRVMRKKEGKDYGYIILPVAVPPNTSPSQALNDNTRFKVVWQILNALRAHDERFNAKINSIALNSPADTLDAETKNGAEALPLEVDHVSSTREIINETNTATDSASSEEGVTESTLALFSLEQWEEAMYVKVVDKVGSRTYWEDWADDVASIAQSQTQRITKLLAIADVSIKEEFDHFLAGLRGNLNDAITTEEAISMLSQHLITAPVFNALFSEHDFAHHNPVSRVMQRMVDALEGANLDAETESLHRFYDSVRVRASEVTSASGKQQVVKELYEKFFRKAFKKQSEALGIVYTPVEIVDFILRSANELSTTHFGKGLSDPGVHVLDPFTGTGTFMVRLLQSGLIRPEDLARKYATELHATEIMLLAYYVAAVNIESTYNALKAEEARRNDEPEPEFVPFEGIALADTFQITEEDDTLDLDYFKDNNAAIQRQMDAPIHVIVGNPPYSVGQTSANDNNQNLKYPTLDARIAETYAAKSTATNKNSLYDSYLRAFRWATDRIGERGIVAFVSNGGWLDANTGDGVRLSMAEDFSDIYVFNLRGNQRTAGELSRKEGGKVFGSGSRNTVVITIGIKDPTASGCTIHYRDIGDYLSAEHKLEIVEHSSPATIDWTTITPNSHGDWLNQRSAKYENWPVLGSKKNTSQLMVFKRFSRGLETGRDSWVNNFSNDRLQNAISSLCSTYNNSLAPIYKWFENNNHLNKNESSVAKFLKERTKYADPKAIKWSRSLRAFAAKGEKVTPQSGSFIHSLYRPFCTQHAYFDKYLNHERSQLPSMFPTPEHDNIGIGVCSTSNRTPFSVLGADRIPNLGLFMDPVQFFPRWTWEPVKAPEGELDLMGAMASDHSEAAQGCEGEILDGYRRVDNITDEILAVYQRALGEDVTKDDIFYFVYGQLHDPSYRETYAADLKKMLPHIETPSSRARFDQLATAGRKLMDLHVNYEQVEPWPVKRGGGRTLPICLRVRRGGCRR